MLVDRSEIVEYPYRGNFTRSLGVDKNLPLDEQEDREELVLCTPCDIQEANKNIAGGFASASYAIYFPCNSKEEVPIRIGDKFVGNMQGVKVDGEVIGLFPSQLGACSCYIKDFDYGK